MTSHPPGGTPPVEVLVVGAGPTGLTLAAQLAAHGVRPRVVDRAADRAGESRALAIQPRTLEVLAGLGLTAALVERGNPAVQLRVHRRGRAVPVPVFDLGLEDTAYPYLLLLSQAVTERVLADHLTAVGVTVERRVELVGLDPGPDAVMARLQHHDGRQELVAARYVAGCDGAHSTVRQLARIPFRGGSYPQTFVLADTEVDGLRPGAVHVYPSGAGFLLFFPLVHPASWRLIAIRPPAERPQGAPVSRGEVQALADSYTGGTVRLHAPVWMTDFRLHHRAAARYRTGRLFLAGDAAHIHSPAGGQGMNTGIQDAVNLGWKLAHTLQGADPALLDTYERERAPVGRFVLRFTDRAFSAATSTRPLARFARARLAPVLVPFALRSRAVRARAFRTVSELAIRYRDSPLSSEGSQPPRTGPHPGDRLPDAVVGHHGASTTLHSVLAAAGWTLLLCGRAGAWDADQLSRLRERHGDRLSVRHLGTQEEPDVLRLPGRRPLPAGTPTQYLIRPDGHVGYRAGGLDLTGLTRYLDHWLPTGPAPWT